MPQSMPHTLTSSTLSVGSGLQRVEQLSAEKRKAMESLKRRYEAAVHQRAQDDALAAALIALDAEAQSHPGAKLVFAMCRALPPECGGATDKNDWAILWDRAEGDARLKLHIQWAGLAIGLLWLDSAESRIASYRLFPPYDGEAWARALVEK